MTVGELILELLKEDPQSPVLIEDDGNRYVDFVYDLFGYVIIG